MKLYSFFSLIIILTKYIIKCNKTECFEYSCEECESPEYGKCTKCFSEFKLVDGTCPCSDSSCALCKTGFAGYHLCFQCKDGYYNYENDCYCNIDNCIQCSENGCLKCKTNYYFNNITNKCEKNKENIICNDKNCKTCYSEEYGACKECKEGYKFEKGSCYELPIPYNNKCPNNYYLNEGYCYEECSGINCTQKYFSDYLCPINKCLICQEKKIKIFSNCDNSLHCTIEGCLNCISRDECVICSQGYYLIEGICKKCIKGCSICSNNETCEYCFSGYELDNNYRCTFTNNYDFNIDVYLFSKEILKSYDFPFEEPDFSFVNLSNVKLCDENCLKCNDNTGICLECDKLYILENNKCIRHCSDENCLNCKLLSNNLEVCLECKIGYFSILEKCEYICTIPLCISCSLLDGRDYCNECINGYKYDKKQGICKKSNNKILVLVIIFSIIALILIFILLLFFIKYKRRNSANQLGNIPIYANDNNLNRRRQILDSSGRAKLNNEELMDEFEIQKRKNEKGNQICQYCKKKIGKFVYDCGCIVCQEHNNINKIIENKEENKIEIKCIICKKNVNNIELIKKTCNICLEIKPSLAHFKCKCSFEVCKDCYVKCKMASDKCPGCREPI